MRRPLTLLLVIALVLSVTSGCRVKPPEATPAPTPQMLYISMFSPWRPEFTTATVKLEWRESLEVEPIPAPEANVGELAKIEGTDIYRTVYKYDNLAVLVNKYYSVVGSGER